MAKRSERKGGLSGVDPAVAAWQGEAAPNVAALTPKQRRDRARVRVRLDVPHWLKEALTSGAEAEGTSANQLGAFMLAWALNLYRQGDPALREALNTNKRVTRTLRIEWDIDLPDGIQKNFDDGAD